MKHILLFAFLLSSGLLISNRNSHIRAQSSAHLEYRPRLIVQEILPAIENQAPSHIAYITQRSRAGLKWKNQHLEAVFTIQDVRYWGGDNTYNDRGVYGNHQSLGLHQAYFIFNSDNKWKWSIGRQLLAFDDERLISLRNWNDYQVSYDALRLSFRHPRMEADVVLSYNSDNNKISNFPAQKYRTFNYLRVGSRNNKFFSYSVSTLLSGKSLSDTSTTLRYLNTWSGYLSYDWDKKYTLAVSAHYQYNVSKTGMAHSAYCLSALFSLRYARNSRLKLGVDCLSGNEISSLGNIERSFDLHYGRRHGYYGLMDYYSKPPGQGLIDIFAKYEQQIAQSSSLQIHLHSFKLEYSCITEEGVNKGKDLGIEMDLVVDYRINAYTVLQAGYGLYLDSSLSRLLKQAPSKGTALPQFGYLLVHLKIPELSLD